MTPNPYNITASIGYEKGLILDFGTAEVFDFVLAGIAEHVEHAPATKGNANEDVTVRLCDCVLPSPEEVMANIPDLDTRIANLARHMILRKIPAKAGDMTQYLDEDERRNLVTREVGEMRASKNLKIDIDIVDLFPS